MNDGWRCFIAVPLADGLRAQLRDAVDRLRSTNPDLDGDWRWVAPEQWHVTLAFLGETDPGSVDELSGLLHAVMRRRPPFRLPTGGLGVFPTPRAARVLWYGVADPQGLLSELADAVRRALGVEAAPLHAHVTLGRSRHRHGVPADALLRDATLPSGVLSVTRAHLYRSHRGPGPARYEVVAASSLRAAGSA